MKKARYCQIKKSLMSSSTTARQGFATGSWHFIKIAFYPNFRYHKIKSKQRNYNVDNKKDHIPSGNTVDIGFCVSFGGFGRGRRI